VDLGFLGPPYHKTTIPSCVFSDLSSNPQNAKAQLLQGEDTSFRYGALCALGALENRILSAMAEVCLSGVDTEMALPGTREYFCKTKPI
jgi:hypothetical protein